MQTNVEASSSAAELSRRFAQMSASEIARELEQTLDAMTDETYDASLIDAYLDELDRRAPMPESPAEDAAWTTFQQHIGVLSQEDAACAAQPSSFQPSPKRKWRRLPFLAAALIACMLMMLVIAQAAGGDLFSTIITWTAETFNLSKSIPQKSAVNDTSSEEVLSDLLNAVDQLGITEPVAPHYIPEGYLPEEFDFDAEFFYITAVYVNGADNIVVNILSNEDGAVFGFEKNSGDPEIYTVNGITFYIMQNIDVYNVVWLTDHYCCSIVNIADKDMIPDILDSVR